MDMLGALFILTSIVVAVKYPLVGIFILGIVVTYLLFYG